jgi:hypothetical protein
MSFTSFASFFVLSLRNGLGVPLTTIPINATTFVLYVLPPLTCYFVVALLAVIPQTRAVRVALWPLVALLALRAALSMDMSLGKPEGKFLNMLMAVSVFQTQTSSNVLRGQTYVRFPPALHACCCYPYP